MNWNRKVQITLNYWHTYNYLLSKLPIDKWINFHYGVKLGFLQQEPNPDYNKWLIKNCKFILFEDWVPQHLPEGFICRTQWGGRNNVHGIIKPRPCICVETGEFFPSAADANRAYDIPGCVNRACRDGVFVWGRDGTQYRFTYIDPFIKDKQPFQSYIYEREAEEKKIQREREGKYYATSGHHWYNNGIEERNAEECPEGWVPGRIKGKKRNYPKNRKPRSKREWEW